MIVFLKNTSIKLFLSNFDIKFDFNQIYLSKYFHITSVRYMVCQKMLTVEFKEVDGSALQSKKKKKSVQNFLPAIASLAVFCHHAMSPFSLVSILCVQKIFLVGVSCVQFLFFIVYNLLLLTF